MYGLILEGGGARGAYHVGAYKALIEEGIEINGIAGTSIGALNGALFIQGDYDIAYKIWQEISYSQIIVANDQKIEKLKQLKIDKEDVSSLLEKAKEVLSEKGFDITPLKNLISEYIDEDKIRNSGKDFGIVTVSLTDWKPLELHIDDIPVGKLSQYIMASAYLPIFKKETFDGKRYLDGGIYNNLPVNLLKEKNYKNLIIVRTHALGHVKKFDLENYNVINISPKKSLGRTFDLDIEAIRNNIQLGYFDGLKALRNLKGYNYYIENIEDENYFINFLSTLSKEKVLELRDLLKIDTEIPYKRSLFEHIIPKLSNLLGVEKEASYNDIFYALLEKLAELYKIEPLKIYSCDELTRLAKEHFELEKGKKIGIVDKVIEKVDLLSLFNKEEIIKEAGKIIL